MRIRPPDATSLSMWRPTTPRALVRAALLATVALAACGGNDPNAGDTGDDTGTDTSVDADGDAQGDDGGDDAGDGGDADRSDVGTDLEAVRNAIEAMEPAVEREIPGLEGTVHVVRTEANRPHIFATNEIDLYRVAGFIMAQDRYFEFELGSRMALGTLSELLGDLTIEVDMESRGTGMAFVADQILANTTPNGRAILEAYADGVNAWQQALRDGTVDPPSELRLVGPLLGVEDPVAILRPVDARSVAGFAAFVVYTSSHGFEDLVRDDVVARLDGAFDGWPLEELRQQGLVEDIWRPVAPVHHVAASEGWGGDQKARPPTGSGLSPQSRPTPRGTALPPAMRERTTALAARQAIRFRRGQRGDFGSNVWAVAAEGTADGRALLAGDGHLSLGIPTVFIQMGLDTTVFGGGDLRQTGLFLTGFPLIGVGTNGHIAWSQTYPRADVTDFYREELRLGDDGLPDASRFDGEWRPLRRVDETFRISGTLGGADTEVVWPRWETFDGRWLIDVEGDVTTADGEGPVVSMLGTYLVPGDEDGDGVVTAISMDYAGFDIGDLVSAVDRIGRSRSVDDFLEAMRGFVGYAQNLGVADVDGRVALGSYTATPCRGYLPREADGGWSEGAHPNRILDGTRFGGFTIPTDTEGRVLEGDPDPYRCVVPFEEWPTTVDPTIAFIANSNNDPAGISFDDRLETSPYHIGGPWDPGFRADTIDGTLREQAASASASVASMAELQADHRSRVGERFGPFLVESVEAAAAAAIDPGGDAAAMRLAAIYGDDAEALDEAATRVRSWLERGASAASGVETFYHAVAQGETEDAVATMIFNAWLREFIALVFEDEEIDWVFRPSGWDRSVVIGSLDRLVRGRGPDNPLGLASWNETTEESAFFDIADTEPVETSTEIALMALSRTLEALRAPPRRGGEGGFGTSDMSGWLWGLRHRVRFPSILVGFAAGNPLIELIAADFSISTARLPLADSFAADDPRRALEWFPRQGDLFGVDAASPSFFGTSYDYQDGPVMRMVIALGGDGVTGQNIIPGGQSGIVESPHFDDQTRLWLANQALPLRHEPGDVLAGATSREEFRPAAGAEGNP